MQQVSAKLVSLSHPKQRSVSTSTDSKTLPYFLTMLWVPWVRSFFSSWPYQLSHFYNFGSCWGKKMEGAEPSPSCTQHTVSPCAWYQHTSVNGMSISLESGTLHSRVIQNLERMLRGPWALWKFYDSIKPHLLIPQLVARGYPLEILVLGTPTNKSLRCLHVCNSYCNIFMGCASSILASCLQSCSWARGLLFEFVQALGYVVLGSVCEEHIDDLSHFVTEQKPYATFPRRSEDRQGSESRNGRVGVDPFMQMNASGKRQIPWTIDRQPS